MSAIGFVDALQAFTTGSTGQRLRAGLSLTNILRSANEDERIELLRTASKTHPDDIAEVIVAQSGDRVDHDQARNLVRLLSDASMSTLKDISGIAQGLVTGSISYDEALREIQAAADMAESSDVPSVSMAGDPQRLDKSDTAVPADFKVGPVPDQQIRSGDNRPDANHLGSGQQLPTVERSEQVDDASERFRRLWDSFGTYDKIEQLPVTRSDQSDDDPLAKIEDIPSGWRRRRALQQLIRTEGVKLGNVPAAMNMMPEGSSRMWVAGTLVDHQNISIVEVAPFLAARDVDRLHMRAGRKHKT